MRSLTSPTSARKAGRPDPSITRPPIIKVSSIANRSLEELKLTILPEAGHGGEGKEVVLLRIPAAEPDRGHSARDPGAHPASPSHPSQSPSLRWEVGIARRVRA